MYLMIMKMQQTALFVVNSCISIRKTQVLFSRSYLLRSAFKIVSWGLRLKLKVIHNLSFNVSL